MDLTGVHGYLLGFAVMAGWALVGLWALVLRLLRREDTPLFWRGVSLAQILLGVQLLVGLVLLLLGRRPGPPGAGGLSLLFHLLYGILFPLVVLVVAHKVAREGRYDPHSVFALAALVIFGLVTRAWMVGIEGFGG